MGQTDDRPPPLLVYAEPSSSTMKTASINTGSRSEAALSFHVPQLKYMVSSAIGAHHQVPYKASRTVAVACNDWNSNYGNSLPVMEIYGTPMANTTKMIIQSRLWDFYLIVCSLKERHLLPIIGFI